MEEEKKTHTHTQFESHCVGFNKSDRYAYNCRTQPASQFDCNFVRPYSKGNAIHCCILSVSFVFLCCSNFIIVLLTISTFGSMIISECLRARDRIQPTDLWKLLLDLWPLETIKWATDKKSTKDEHKQSTLPEYICVLCVSVACVYLSNYYVNWDSANTRSSTHLKV